MSGISRWGIHLCAAARQVPAWFDAGDGAVVFDAAVGERGLFPRQEQACTGDAFRLCGSEFRMSIASRPA